MGDIKPNSHTCTTCETEHKWTGYVFAHWRESIIHACSKCGERTMLLKGKATVTQKGEPR